MTIVVKRRGTPLNLLQGTGKFGSSLSFEFLFQK